MSDSISQSINPNYRFNTFFERVNGVKQIFKSDDTAKVVSLALPLLTLFRPLQPALTLQSGLANSYAIISNISNHYQRGNTESIIPHFSELTLTVALTGLSIFKPRTAILLEEVVKVIQNICDLSLSVCNLQGKQAAIKLLSLSHSAVFIASLTIATPELIAISIIAQGTLELYQAYQEYKADHKIEAGFKLLQGSIRLIGAKPYIEKSYERARFTYDNHHRQKLIQQTLYNNPRDEYFIIKPKDTLKTQQHTLHLENQMTTEPLIEVQTNEGKERFFHAHLRAPVSARDTMSASLPDQYVKSIQEQTNILFDPKTNTCFHEDFGNGRWELKSEHRKYKFTPHWAAPEMDNYSLSLAVNFDKDSKISPAQIIDKVRIKKSPPLKGTEMTSLKWVLERFF